MNFQQMGNAQFFASFKEKVADERRITIEVLHFFREAERRMLYAEYDCSSLLGFAIKELKYSEPAANRRISAMRILKDVPEAAEKIKAGDLTLTTVTQACTFIRQTEKYKKTKATKQEKRDVLKSIENQSCRQAERTLIELCPELRPLVEEKMRAISSGATQVTTVLDLELMNKLEEIQNLLGRKMQIKDLLDYMADEQLKKLRKQRGLDRPVPLDNPAAKLEKDLEHTEIEKIRVAKPAPTVAPIATLNKPPAVTPHVPPNSENGPSTKRRAYIPIQIKKQLWRQSQARCEWLDPLTQKRCEERRYLEIEHLLPIALGGTDQIDNLQLICRTHNKLRAVEKLGAQKMSRFVASLDCSHKCI